MCSLFTFAFLQRVAPYFLLAFLLLSSLVCFVLRCTSSVSDEEAIFLIAFLTFLFELVNSLLHIHHLS
jgi:hypothetical protein